jgi:hypothetical protein
MEKRLTNNISIDNDELRILNKLNDEKIDKYFFDFDQQDRSLFALFTKEPNLMPFWAVIEKNHVISVSIFANDDMDYFFGEFANFSHLKKLILYDIGIDEEKLNEFPVHYLTQLNKIVLPNSISKLSTLIHLKITGKFHMLVPKTIHLSNSLETLELYEVELSNFPLNEANSEFSTFPTAFSQLRNLKIFSWQYNTLQKLPMNLVQLKNLKKIDIQYSNLQDIDIDFDHFPELEEINFNHTKISSIPYSLDKLIKNGIIKWGLS